MLRMNKLIVAIALCALLSLPFAACKSEEQIAAAQTTTGIRDVIYNEAEEKPMRTIIVKGSGETKVAPDTASITFTANARDKDAAKAQTQSDELVQALTTILLEDGVAQKDIKTQSLNLSEQYDYSKSTPVLTGYEASSRVQVTVRRVENLSKIIADAVSVGVTNYDSLNFAAADTAAGYDEALGLAVQDAARKAEAIAAAAEKALLNIASIEEQSVSQAIRYDATNAAMESATADAMAGGAEISTGEITVTAEVVITYEIQ